jgi:hypothetical protein
MLTRRVIRISDGSGIKITLVLSLILGGSGAAWNLDNSLGSRDFLGDNGLLGDMHVAVSC